MKMADDELRQREQKNIKKETKKVPAIMPTKAPEQKQKKKPSETLQEQNKDSGQEEPLSQAEDKKGVKEQLQERIAAAKGGQKPEKGKEKKVEAKVILEREYIVPLRKEWLKVPEYKRANKAVKALKEFIAQHMKVYDRDLRKIKIDILLNNEIRFRGMKKPPSKIKVKALKKDDGSVEVKLVDIPVHISFELARDARKQVEKLKKAEDKKKEEKVKKKEEKPKEIIKPKDEEDEAKEKDEKEKKEASREAQMSLEKQQAKQQKHQTGGKKEPIVHRKALQK
jgi:large subunit ribosomal protein L31e